MPGLISSKTLESLEWPLLMDMFVRQCRTPGARLRLGALARDDDHEDESHAQDGNLEGIHEEEIAPYAIGEFEETLDGVHHRLAETQEARTLLEAHEQPPLSGVTDLRHFLRRAGMGGVLSAQQLLTIRSSLETLRRAVDYMAQRGGTAPRLADLASTALTYPELERRIERCFDPSGEVRDSASPALAQARREVSRFSSQLQNQLSRYLHDPEVSAGLSDNYYTVRNDRYVLPVQASFKSRVPGIVHDASRSGATLFIEPQEVVDLNNRLKQAEFAQTREIERILRELSSAVAEVIPTLDTSFEALTRIDLAFARGHLAIEMDAVMPQVEREGVFDLPQLRHPLIPPEESIPNDISIGLDYTVLVISGPNGGGKTIAMKAVGLAALMVRLGLFVPASEGARVDFVDDILVDIGDGQDLRESLSTFSAHMVNLSAIVSGAGPHTLALLDEIGVGTDPGEGAALAQAVLEVLAKRGCRVITTTHYNLLKEMAEVDERFRNASVEFDPVTLAPTYRLHTGTAGSSSAAAVAARMGMPSEVLERANALLESEDRQLDQMLAELSTSRVALEREKQEATRLRAESETVRSEYLHKLERLQERRDKLFHAMREDLDRTFKDAHAQVAAVIRDLQRSGSQDSRSAAQAAAHARKRLLGLEAASKDAEESDAAANQSEDATLAIDWRHAKPGDPVLVPGGGKGVLESLPDRRGRVRVRVGSSKLVLESDRLKAAVETTASGTKNAGATQRAVHSPSAAPENEQVAGGVSECDLRGMRVDEAMDDLYSALDRALHQGNEQLRVIHGFGTGALRSAVRESLAASALVLQYRPGERSEGGDGVTLATLRQ